MIPHPEQSLLFSHSVLRRVCSCLSPRAASPPKRVADAPGSSLPVSLLFGAAGSPPVGRAGLGVKVFTLLLPRTICSSCLWLPGALRWPPRSEEGAARCLRPNFSTCGALPHPFLPKSIRPRRQAQNARANLLGQNRLQKCTFYSYEVEGFADHRLQKSP